MENKRFQCYPFTVYTYDKVDSTNSVARRAIEIEEHRMDMSAHVAGEQTCGKGRSGRTWLNTEDAVMMSIVIRTKLTMEKMPILNLVAAKAVRDAVKEITDGRVNLAIKWPNDLITEDRNEKVCGILSEAISYKNKKYAVIGIGLNLNARELPEGLLQPASSVYLQYGKYIRILDAVEAILKNFDVQHRLMLKDTDAFLKDFAKDCVSVGRRVMVNYGDRVLYGAGDKLAPNGQLIVRFENGETDAVYAADVSVRNLIRIDDKLALKLRPARKPSSNKGDHGRAAMIVGSENAPGAALMSVKACIRSGAGLTKALIPKEIRDFLSVVPEAMLMTDDYGADELLSWATSVGIGCGCGVSDRTCGLLEKVLRSKKPCVIDADALNTLAAHPELYELLHDKAVLTPHPMEMSRLTSRPKDEILADFTATALGFAQRYGCIVHLKSDVSVIASPDGDLRYNDSGTSGLAKGGSGDVLAGLITGLMAQGVCPFDASALGAYLLGKSAEKALDYLHNRFVSAGDIIDIISSEVKEKKK